MDVGIVFVNNFHKRCNFSALELFPLQSTQKFNNKS